MRAYARHGKTWMDVRAAQNARYRPDGIAAFAGDQAYLRQERQYLRWHSRPALRRFIGPLPYNGPVWDGKRPYVGKIIGGRVFNGVAMIHYVCQRGMDQETFDRYVETLRRVLARMRSYEGPRLP